MIGRTYRPGKEKRLAIDNSQLPRVHNQTIVNWRKLKPSEEKNEGLKIFILLLIRGNWLCQSACTALVRKKNEELKFFIISVRS